MRVPLILVVLATLAFACKSGSSGKTSQASATVLENLCTGILARSESMPIPDSPPYRDDEDDGNNGHGNGQHRDDDDDSSSGDRDEGDNEDDYDDDEGDDDDGDDGGDDDDDGCHAPAARQRLRRLAESSPSARGNAARQILSKGPRFSDVVLLSATAVSGDLRDVKARESLARVVLQRFDRCERPLSAPLRANAAFALGLIADTPQRLGNGEWLWNRVDRDRDDDDDDDDDDGDDGDSDGNGLNDPEYVYWTLSAAACAAELDVRHAGVRGLGQLRDERARPLLEAIAEMPSTGDDVQDALLSLSANRSLTTIFPSNSVTPDVVETAKDGLGALREAIVEAEVAP